MQNASQVAASRGILMDAFVIRNGAILVLVADYVYALSFNFLPDGPRLAFAGVVWVLNAILAVIAYATRQNRTSNLILMALVITCVCWGLSYALGYSGGGKGFTLQSVAKQLGVYLIIMWVLAFPEIMPRRLIAFLAVFTLVVGGGYAAVAPRVNVAGEEFFAHITGISQAYAVLSLEGRTDILIGARHVSATLILINVLIVDQLRRLRVLPPVLAWTLILFGTYVVFGYWSRNNIVSLVVYFLFTFYYDSKYSRLIGSIYFLFAGLLIVFMIGAFFFVDKSDLYYWGSGRIGTYVHRIDILSVRDLGSLLIGSGLSSDWFRSYTWLYTEKPSHNLLLSIVIETGLLGLVSHILFMIAIYFNLPHGRPKAFFYMILVSGLISHGFLADTQFLVMLFAAVALAIMVAKESVPTNPG